MGLDLGTPSGLELDASGEEAAPSLRDVAESAIRSALRLKRDTITFYFNGAALKDGDVAAVCADLQKQYPALKEIVPGKTDSATAHLSEQSGQLKKFVLRYKPVEV
jgi:hypothetical protein